MQVDDCIARADGNLGGTTLGPRWPELQLVGRVCIEENTWSRLPVALRTPSRPLGGRGYEYLSAVYWPHIDDPRAGRRYVGHYAEILDEKDTIARVAIYRAGASLQDGARPMTTMWLDLVSPGQCDAGPASLTEIGVGKAPKKNHRRLRGPREVCAEQGLPIVITVAASDPIRSRSPPTTRVDVSRSHHEQHRWSIPDGQRDTHSSSPGSWIAVSHGRAIWCTGDLVRWSRVAVVTGFRPQSLAVLDGALYIGTQDAELYRLVGWP